MNDDAAKQAADLFFQHFEPGEDVVVEDIYGDFHAGQIIRMLGDLHLGVRVRGTILELDWNEVVFVAHSGFPVHAIARMSPEEAARLAKSFDTELAREVVLGMLRDKPEQQERPQPKRRRMTWGGGCPFVFEDVRVEALRNPGNNGPRFWGQDDEEELVMTAADGATCLSYDLSHLFFVEAAGFSLGTAP